MIVGICGRCNFIGFGLGIFGWHGRMVRMVARAFYDDVSLARDPKSARGDNCGLAVVVLEALGRRRQWVREEDLAKALKISSKQLRRILQFFEEEKLVRRCHRKE
ncbi:Os11g0137400 [Oryza sativa Japonica Group]|uniref:Os11g0137400 protein n=1 Tax=Oryza sativa subsp. japonica TaxID=39947 RepID=A0A0P0XZ21_ORYSJ|nr:hypothetical protein EE612_053379 [Oryza sativa]BAT12580.1 Os11g0137400 [Oryza sativa Japonica Group]